MSYRSRVVRDWASRELLDFFQSCHVDNWRLFCQSQQQPVEKTTLLLRRCYLKVNTVCHGEGKLKVKISILFPESFLINSVDQKKTQNQSRQLEAVATWRNIWRVFFSRELIMRKKEWRP